MPNVISWKKSEIASLRGQMEDFFDHFFLRLSRSSQESGLMEVADWLVEEDDQHLLLKLLVPDASPEDIDMAIRGSMSMVEPAGTWQYAQSVC